MKKKTSKVETISAKVAKATKLKVIKKSKRLKVSVSKVVSDILEKNL